MAYITNDEAIYEKLKQQDAKIDQLNIQINTLINQLQLSSK